MGAPARQPHHFDAADPDGPGLFAYRAVTWLIDRIADAVRDQPDWASGGQTVRLAIEAHEPGRSLTVGAGPLRLRFAPHSAGWLEIVVEREGAVLLAAYADHPYEDYELWPANAAAEVGLDSPGRAGKRLNWVQLAVSAWPALADHAPGGVFGAEAKG